MASQFAPNLPRFEPLEAEPVLPCEGLQLLRPLEKESMFSTGLAILGLITTPLCWFFSMRILDRGSRILFVLVGAAIITTLLIWATVWAEEFELAWALRRFKDGAVYHWDFEAMTASERAAYGRWHSTDLSNRFAMVYAPLSGIFLTAAWNGVLLFGALLLRRWTPFHRLPAQGWGCVSPPDLESPQP